VDAASYSADGAYWIVLYTAPLSCSDIATSAVTPNTSSLVLRLPSAPAAMTYSGVEVQFSEFDGTCNASNGESGSGTVTLTAASASSVSGTFQLYLNADTITGSFVAPTCAVDAGTGATTCK
jgi:hypothetical protein